MGELAPSEVRGKHADNLSLLMDRETKLRKAKYRVIVFKKWIMRRQCEKNKLGLETTSFSEYLYTCGEWNN